MTPQVDSFNKPFILSVENPENVDTQCYNKGFRAYPPMDRERDRKKDESDRKRPKIGGIFMSCSWVKLPQNKTMA